MVDKYFASDGQMIQHVWSPSGAPDGQPRTKQFQVHAASLPRFYLTWFNSGLQSMSLTIEGAKESTQGGSPRVTCQRARYTFWYANGTQVCLTPGIFTPESETLTHFKSIWSGNLTVIFAHTLPTEEPKFQNLEFEINKTEEYVSRAHIDRVLTAGSPLMNNKSPKTSRTPGKNKALKMQQEPLSASDFPSAPVNEYGVTSAVMQFFEVIGQSINVHQGREVN